MAVGPDAALLAILIAFAGLRGEAGGTDSRSRRLGDERTNGRRCNRREVGVERILWSRDCPHISADWPLSWRVILSSISGVPLAERRTILAGNAQRLYHFG